MDQSLQGNEKIVEAINMLKQEPSQECLAHALTIIRHRMQEKGHLIPSVEQGDDGNFQLKTITVDEGKQWFTAFTDFDEQLKGKDAVMSAFTAEIGSLFLTTLRSDGIEGLIINPWDHTIMLDKNLIRIIIGARQ